MKITDNEHAYLQALTLAIIAPTEEKSLECQKIAASIEPHLTDKQIEEGWKFIFDGKSSDGWIGSNSDEFPRKGWKINNGVLTVLSADGQESANGGDIITKEKYKNYLTILTQ